MGGNTTRTLRRMIRWWRLTLPVGLVLLVVSVRLVWGWHESRRLAALLHEIADERKASLSTASELSNLPDSQNAWSKYKAAMAAASTTIGA